MSTCAPFANLDLRRNPFGELTREEWMEAAILDADRWVDRLKQPKVAVQFLAPHGRGKTTHLLALSQRLPESTYHRATRGPMPEEGELLLLDEADSLWSWQRAAAARRWTSIAFSTHRDLSVEFRLWGFRVETHRVSAGSFQQIERIVSRRIELAKQRKGAPPRPSQQHLQQLHKRHGDDVRTIFDELYEHYQQLVRNHVQM